MQKLVAASEILHEIFLEQVWRSNLAYREDLGTAAGPGMDAAREYYAIMAGPWDRLEHNAPFLDVGPKPPGAGYYPEGLAKTEIEAFLAAHPGMRDAFTSYYTVILRTGTPELPLFARPYSDVYREP